MNKYYLVEFQNAGIKAVDEIDELRAAVQKCSLNILSKYGLQLQLPTVVADRYVVLEIGIKDSNTDSAAGTLGRQLRSISDYLVHNYNKYTSNNTRLLIYKEIPKPDFDNRTPAPGEPDPLDLLARIVDLLKSPDPAAKDKLRAINAILNK